LVIDCGKPVIRYDGNRTVRIRVENGFLECSDHPVYGFNRLESLRAKRLVGVLQVIQ